MIRPCIVIPFYNHEGSIAAVVQSLKVFGLRCFIVNDGSDARCAPVLSDIQKREPWVSVLSYRPNQGKGRAVMTGLNEAFAQGFTHALQIDADGQHDVSAARKMLALAEQYPRAMIAGYSIYDESVPKSRLYGRYATHVWVWINTLSTAIRDTMCGLRVYPLDLTLDLLRRARVGTRMSFDIEILVRLHWRGVRIVNVPAPVSYPLDGVSHFKVWRDNLQISAAHARLFVGMLWRLPLLLGRKLFARGPA